MTSHDLRLRLRVLRRRARLDRALADGTEPDGDPALALRARQLTSQSTRRGVANALDHLLEAAEEPPETWGRNGPRPPLQRHAVLVNRQELAALADRLRDPEAMSPQAVALASMLVWDVGSPVYTPRLDATIGSWVEAVEAASPFSHIGSVSRR